MGEDPSTARAPLADGGDVPAAAGSEAPGVQTAGSGAAGSEAPGIQTAGSGAAGGSQAAGSQDPEQIREQIEATRAEMGDTVEALAAKADVKSQIREKVASTKQSASQKLGQAREASPDSVSSGATQAGQIARQNPIPVAVAGAFAGGFLLGRLTKH